MIAIGPSDSGLARPKMSSSNLLTVALDSLGKFSEQTIFIIVSESNGHDGAEHERRPSGYPSYAIGLPES